MTMGTIGVYDADFFPYENVMPNLECAKIVTYYRNHREIAILSATPNTEFFSRFFFRKEYDDGIFSKKIFDSNCEYGGRAFNPSKYVPLPKAIEMTAPDMHIYDKYINNFSSKKTYREIFKRILNCAHLRLAPDSQNILSIEQLNKLSPQAYSGLFFHDYDIASLDAYDTIVELQSQRKFKLSGEPNPYPVGNKYPINIYTPADLQKWSKIIVIPNCFFLEYHGLMDANTFYSLVIDNRRMARQINYDVTYGCSSENNFLMHRLPEIFL